MSVAKKTNTHPASQGACKFPTPKQVCIYALLCPDTLLIRYIGKTNNPKHRLVSHISEAKTRCKNRRHKWINSLTNAGKRPILKVLEWVEQDNWPEREAYYISIYPDNRLTNGTPGGDGMTSEAAKKLWLNPEYRAKQVSAATGANNGFYKHTHTEETKAILAEKCRHEIPWNKGKTNVYSDKLIEKNRLQAHRKKVSRFDKQGNFIDEWQSIRALCRELGWDRRQVVRVLNKEQSFNSIKGFCLQYT